MRYVEVPPPPALRRIVDCLWALEEEPGGPADPARSAEVEPVLPDGCPELIVHLGDPFREHPPGGPPRRQHRSFLVGQIREPMELEPGGRVAVLGIRFRPHAARCLLGAPLIDITGRSVELEAIAPGLARALEERLAGEASRNARFAAASALLVRALRPSRLDPVLEATVERMRSKAGATPVGRLAEAAGLSARQLQRRFRRDVGLGPKYLSRVFRFQGVFRLLSGGRTPDWAALAPECGYADQAHLVREFGAFAGRPPAAFFREPPELASHFVTGGEGGRRVRSIRGPDAVSPWRTVPGSTRRRPCRGHLPRSPGGVTWRGRAEPGPSRTGPG